MNKILSKGKDKIMNIAKQVGKDSSNTISMFLYYEPKAPGSINESVENQYKYKT